MCKAGGHYKWLKNLFILTMPKTTVYIQTSWLLNQQGVPTSKTTNVALQESQALLCSATPPFLFSSFSMPHYGLAPVTLWHYNLHFFDFVSLICLPHQTADQWKQGLDHLRFTSLRTQRMTAGRHCSPNKHLLKEGMRKRKRWETH